MKKYLLILTLFFSSFLFAQNQAKIDSLENALVKAKNNAAKADILTGLFEEYANYDIDKAKLYSDKLFDLAKTNKDDYVYYSAYFSKGIHQYYISEFENSIKSMKQALAYAEKLKKQKLITKAHCQLGRFYFVVSKNDSALYFTDKTIESSKKSNDIDNYTAALLEKGNYYFRQREANKSLQYFNMIDSIWSKTNTKNSNLAIALSGASMVLIEISEFDKAENYSFRAKKIGEEIGSIEAVMKAERALGVLAIYKKDYETGKEKINKVLEYYVSVKNKKEEGNLLSILGHISIQQGDFKQAEIYLLKGAEISKEAGAPRETASSLIELARLYLKQKNYAKSQKYYTEALEINQKIPDLSGQVICNLALAKINYETQNYKTTTEYLLTYISLKDSLTKKRNFEITTELETKYQTAQKQQQIELLSAEKELAEQKRKSQLTVFAALVGLLLIAGATLAFAYRNKLRTAEKIRELNQLKSRFFANISHEFRTPLTLIKSPLQNLQAEIGDENQQKQLSLIDKNSDRMLELVNQLLELSKIDSGKLQLILKEGEIGSFLKSISESFAYRAKENGLKFSSEIEVSEGRYSYDKDVIEKIVTNLLSNAVKYTPENNEVNFSSTIENETLKIKVSNSGTNLKNKDLPKLFERFHQTDNQNEGFGIGLALIKELVDLYKGKIETTVKDGVLSFSVTLPLSLSGSENILIPTQTQTDADEISNMETSTEKELPLLLIVDDNPEIRTVIQQVFENDYTVLQAEDGNSALKTAQKEIPDCIISDVMMPGMDGFEFTKAIKENELTSFIPVILLTAKTSDEARLEALQNEADAFLTKPFHNEILKQTVQQLIGERKKLQLRYSRELILKPVDIVLNTIDERFLEKLGEITEKQLSNPDFSTDEFASELGMSRMQLHRKLKSLLNVSTTEFIRNERLKAAAELMKKGNKNVSEIAYTVGFNDVSYFSKCFKDLYNKTPSEYILSI